MLNGVEMAEDLVEMDMEDSGRWGDVGILNMSEMAASKVDSRFWMRPVRPSGGMKSLGYWSGVKRQGFDE